MSPRPLDLNVNEIFLLQGTTAASAQCPRDDSARVQQRGFETGASCKAWKLHQHAAKLGKLYSYVRRDGLQPKNAMASTVRSSTEDSGVVVPCRIQCRVGHLPHRLRSEGWRRMLDHAGSSRTDMKYQE